MGVGEGGGGGTVEEGQTHSARKHIVTAQSCVSQVQRRSAWDPRQEEPQEQRAHAPLHLAEQSGAAQRKHGPGMPH